jgi:hypothetical protein
VGWTPQLQGEPQRASPRRLKERKKERRAVTAGSSSGKKGDEVGNSMFDLENDLAGWPGRSARRR